VAKENKTAWMLIAEYAREGVVWKLTSMGLLIAVIIMAVALTKVAQSPKRMYVVPGALKAGFYAPAEGMDDIMGDVVRDMAERFVLNISNISNDTTDEVSKRSLRYLSPLFKSKFTEDQKIVSDAYKSGSISTIFSIESDKTAVKKLDAKTYEVKFIGMRDVISHGEAKPTEAYFYEVTIEKIDVSDMNAYGLQIIDVRRGALQKS
jgi:hypothetical protein